MGILPFSKIRNIVVIIALLVLTGGVGYRLGEKHAFSDGAITAVNGSSTSADTKVVNTRVPSDANVDFSLFWDVWDRMFRYYIDADELNKQEMVWGAISGMVGAAGDPYTTFLPPKDNEDFKQDLGGQFEGIGAQLGMKEGRVIVVAPLKGNPAESAGLLPGDFILEVDGQDTNGWTLPEAVSNIRGERGTTVVLGILHENAREPVDISIVRDTINVPSVDLWIKQASEIEEISGLEDIGFDIAGSDRVAYISLTRFGDRTNQEWNTAMRTLKSELSGSNSPKGVILDLRNNPGGYLQGSVYIASEFVNDGTIVTQVNSNGTEDHFTVTRKGVLTDVPVIVLINGGSASASEIVAGALKDHGRATLVGEQSFGKGTVQTPQDLRDGAGLHVTTGKWLLPSGNTIANEGLTPDDLVEMDNYTATTDAQLAKAIELLLQ